MTDLLKLYEIYLSYMAAEFPEDTKRDLASEISFNRFKNGILQGMLWTVDDDGNELQINLDAKNCLLVYCVNNLHVKVEKFASHAELVNVLSGATFDDLLRNFPEV